MSKPALGRGLDSLMKPSAGEPAQTVRITVSANDAPGLRQFLNRRAETNATGEAEPEPPATQPSVSSVDREFTPTWIGAVLLAADAVVVGLSAVLLAQGQSLPLQAIGCAGIVAGAVLGVLGVSLWSRSR